jgi:hypothetical protein
MGETAGTSADPVQLPKAISWKNSDREHTGQEYMDKNGR